MQNEPRTHEFNIHIHLSRQLAAVLILAMLALAAWALLTWGSKPVEASSPQAPAAVSSSSGMRKFYLTASMTQGNGPADPGVCQPGYHFASIWEILDVSNLEYDDNPAYAYLRDDMGDGPPTGWHGWVRTGYNDSTDGPNGQINCDGWTSISSSVTYGATAKLPSDWSDAGNQILHVWETGGAGCNLYLNVWCIED